MSIIALFGYNYYIVLNRILLGDVLLNFFKSIVVGMGAVTPGLSGSILLVIFGLYHSVISSIANIFKSFKKNFVFLLPIILGIAVGVILFGKVVNFLLLNYEVKTRCTFLGLILGTIPSFYKITLNNKKKSKKYLKIKVLSFLIGVIFVIFSRIKSIGISIGHIQKYIFLGIVLGITYITPGVDGASILSTLGLYELYISLIASLDLKALFFVLIIATISIYLFSKILNYLIIKHKYGTYSVLFGFFCSTIPSIISKNCIEAILVKPVLLFCYIVFGVLISYNFGKIVVIKKK